MDGKQALYYGAIALAVLVGVGILVSVVWWFLNLVLAVVSGIVFLAIFAGIAYVAYRAGSWLSGSDDSIDADSIGDSWSSSSTDNAPESRQDRLRRQYVEGQISEVEFERRIESELETEEFDELDREIERER